MQFIIFGVPISKARHRTFVKNGKTHTYDPKSDQKNAIRFEIVSQMLKNGLNLIQDGAIEVDMSFHMEIPKTLSKASKMRLNGKPCIKKNGDIDNFIKFFLDVMNGVVYVDDSQVYKTSAEKTYSMTPKTTIQIKKL
jgi:Holliday junction resolvase RusA-like endonuclease